MGHQMQLEVAKSKETNVGLYSSTAWLNFGSFLPQFTVTLEGCYWSVLETGC